MKEQKTKEYLKGQMDCGKLPRQGFHVTKLKERPFEGDGVADIIRKTGVGFYDPHGKRVEQPQETVVEELSKMTPEEMFEKLSDPEKVSELFHRYCDERERQKR